MNILASMKTLNSARINIHRCQLLSFYINFFPMLLCLRLSLSTYLFTLSTVFFYEYLNQAHISTEYPKLIDVTIKRYIYRKLYRELYLYKIIIYGINGLLRKNIEILGII
jgi:hypothetical protein